MVPPGPGIALLDHGSSIVGRTLSARGLTRVAGRVGFVGGTRLVPPQEREAGRHARDQLCTFRPVLALRDQAPGRGAQLCRIPPASGGGSATAPCHPPVGGRSVGGDGPAARREAAAAPDSTASSVRRSSASSSVPRPLTGLPRSRPSATALPHPWPTRRHSGRVAVPTSAGGQGMNLTPLRRPRRGPAAATPVPFQCGCGLAPRVYADMTTRLGTDGPSVLPADNRWCPNAPPELTSAGTENPDAAAVPPRDEGRMPPPAGTCRASASRALVRCCPKSRARSSADRASASGAEGRGFESRRARQPRFAARPSRSREQVGPARRGRTE